MIKRQILLVGNDLSVCNPIQECMQNRNMEVSCIRAISEALDSFINHDYCLAIIDFQRLEVYSLKMLRMMRTAKRTPVLALIDDLTADEKVILLQAGANAYMEKPVDLNICAAQSEALIKLYWDSDDSSKVDKPLVFGTELVIHPLQRQVIVDGKFVDLTRTEFDLLFCMAQHPGRVWSRNQLYSQVWTDDPNASDDNTVRAHIGNLRKKLAITGKIYIQNIRGIGYRFALPTEDMQGKKGTANSSIWSQYLLGNDNES